MNQAEQRYQVRLINGRTIDDLSYEEATEYFYSHASSSVRPWPIREYHAP